MLTQAPPKSVLNALALRAFGTLGLAYLIKKKSKEVSGTTPHPTYKLQVVLDSVPRLAEGEDLAPHSGYELTAPTHYGRYLHWRPSPCQCYKMWKKYTPRVHLLQRKIKKVSTHYQKSGADGKTMVGLLRDWVLLTTNKAWEKGTTIQVTAILLGVLITLTRTDVHEGHYDPYDRVDRPPP